jgi:hypothetical protein
VAPRSRTPGRPSQAWSGGSLREFLRRLSQFPLSFLARRIHGGFYCNCGYAAVTSQHAGKPACWRAGSPLLGLNVLFQVCLGLSGLRTPVSLGVSTGSSRIPMNKAIRRAGDASAGPRSSGKVRSSHTGQPRSLCLQNHAGLRSVNSSFGGLTSLFLVLFLAQPNARWALSN